MEEQDRGLEIVGGMIFMNDVNDDDGSVYHIGPRLTFKRGQAGNLSRCAQHKDSAKEGI